MKFIQKNTIFVVVLTTLLAFVNASSFFDHESEIGLLNYMKRSSDLLQQDPTRSLDCFNKYIPLINEIANDYEINFKACLNDSEAASTKADDATLGQRNHLANATEAACILLTQCHERNSVEEIFQCYIDGGSANTQTMYIINANASQELAALRENYYLIKNEEYKCRNETKRVYEQTTAEAYASLNNCILGNPDTVVTKEPSTTAETTTIAPTEPTEETTSVEPETSDNPTTNPETTKETTSTSENPEESSALPEYFY